MNFVSETPLIISDKLILPKSSLEMTKKTPGKFSSKKTYSGWIIDHSTSTALLAHDDLKQPIQIKLMRTSVGAIYEGWWPQKPTREPHLVISGSCLLDARWQMEFARRGKKSVPARRKLSLVRQKEDALRRLREGHVATRIYVPSSLGEYHQTVIKWQVAQFKRLQVSRVLYHIPTEAYRLTVIEIENELGFKCPKLHEKLSEFAAMVQEEVKRQLGNHNVELCIIDPVKEGKAKTALESYLHPYVRTKDYCADPSRTIGVEDLGESRLAREAFMRTGVKIPLLGAVLGVPHPFRSETLRDGHFVVIELN